MIPEDSVDAGDVLLHLLRDGGVVGGLIGPGMGGPDAAVGVGRVEGRQVQRGEVEQY